MNRAEAFRDLLRTSDVQPVRLPARSPNLNAYAERFVRSIKSECTERVIFFGERAMRYAINEYIVHYNTERPHQGIGNRTISLDPESPPASAVMCRERLGGLLRSYTGVAA